MNPSDDNNFVIEDNAPLVNPVLETPVQTSTFPILPHLIVLGAILFGLFATVIIPKTVSILQPEQTVAVVLPPTEKTSTILPITTSAFDNIEIRGKSAFVWDINKQKVLFAKNADEALPLASITKLMTALVAYEVLPNETPVTITKEASAQQSGGTLKWGEVFVAKDLANFALISSYNSAAFTLAASVGALLGEANPTEHFVTGMNLKAQDLNLTSLKFFNPTGLDLSTTEAGAYGSARDVSLLMEYILLNYPEILDPTVKPNTRLYNNQGEYHEADNTNDLVRDIPNLLGSKTGYTDLAGGNLTIVFDAGLNHPIVITVLGSTHAERFTDVKELMKAAIVTASIE